MTPVRTLTIAFVIGLAFTGQAIAQDTSPPEPGSGGQLIDLPSALKLAGANNLDLALIRQSLIQAEASDDAATLKFFPWVSPGSSPTVLPSRRS
jgi:hypothetical protein